MIHVRPITHFHNDENDPPARVVKVPDGIAMEIDAHVPTDGLAEQWGVVQLRFKDRETMVKYFMGFDGEVGPIGLAIARDNAVRANRPINVIKRAFQGSFADDDAQAEIIVKDLVEAGHLPESALEDL